MILMACENSTTYLLTGLSHAGLHNYNGRQIELFHMKNIIFKYFELSIYNFNKKNLE